jgi:hypothetical protein
VRGLRCSQGVIPKVSFDRCENDMRRISAAQEYATAEVAQELGKYEQR